MRTDGASIPAVTAMSLAWGFHPVPLPDRLLAGGHLPSAEDIALSTFPLSTLSHAPREHDPDGSKKDTENGTVSIPRCQRKAPDGAQKTRHIHAPASPAIILDPLDSPDSHIPRFTRSPRIPRTSTMHACPPNNISGADPIMHHPPLSSIPKEGQESSSIPVSLFGGMRT